MKRGFAISFTFLLLILSANAALAQTVGSCAVFPSDNPWNREIYYDPVHPQSTTFINGIIASRTRDSERFLHPDFGEDPSYGIPWTTVNNAEAVQFAAPVDFFDWPDESDLGNYPIPTDAPVEGSSGGSQCNGGDCHVIVIHADGTTCILYELYNAYYDNGWHASNGAIFDLNSNALRHDGWTSGDAAGLPIFPGLVRCSEVEAGQINHALRFTIRQPNRGYVFPARHFSYNMTVNAGRPSYGARMRLKADFDLSGFTGQALVIATAMKHYGLILADIGSNFYITGETNHSDPANPLCSWNDDNLSQLKAIPGTAFEFVAYPATTAAAPRTNHFMTGTPTLTWAGVTWATNYEIQVDDTSTMASPIYTFSVTGANNSVLVSPALPDGRYYWRVRAQRPDNTWGGYSSIETFTVDA